MNSKNVDIAIVFPPLVNSGFGNYYPSLAVLSGFLKRAGKTVRQLDLNESLIEYLLEDEMLEVLRKGIFVKDNEILSSRSKPVLAARVLSDHKYKLFDESGRHKFNELEPGPSYLLRDLAAPYHINFTIEELLKLLKSDWPLKNWYMDFYKTQGLSSVNTKLFGISIAMGPQLAPALFLAEALKEINPDCRVVIGGPGISLMEESELKNILKQCECIDAAVRYDGEIPLLDIVNDVGSNNWNPSEIDGVASLIENKVVVNPPKNGVQMHDLAWADYDKELLKKLHNPELGIQLTRGCYWGECAYCDFVELYEGSPSFRTRRAKEFVDEVEFQVKEHGLTNFSFITEAIPPGFARRFSELILERNLKITWNSFAMVDKRFTSEHFELMVKSGCENLVVGVETSIDRVLSLVKKQANGNQGFNFMKDASENGIKLFVNLIPDLPTTTYQEAMDALEDFREVGQYIYGIAVFPFEATKSSEIGRNPQDYGLVTRSLEEEEADGGQAEFASNHLKITDDAMTAEEREEVIRAYRDFSIELGNRQFVSNINSWKSFDQFKYNQHHLDILEDESGYQIFNWELRIAWEAQKGVKELIKILSQKKNQKFSRGEFNDSFGLDVGNHLLLELESKGIITGIE